MLRKTLNGINDLIVYKFVSDNDVEQTVMAFLDSHVRLKSMREVKKH